jgi:hypothetical protein
MLKMMRWRQSIAGANVVRGGAAAHHVRLNEHEIPETKMNFRKGPHEIPSTYFRRMTIHESDSNSLPGGTYATNKAITLRPRAIPDCAENA